MRKLFGMIRLITHQNETNKQQLIFIRWLWLITQEAEVAQYHEDLQNCLKMTFKRNTTSFFNALKKEYTEISVSTSITKIRECKSGTKCLRKSHPTKQPYISKFLLRVMLNLAMCASSHRRDPSSASVILYRLCSCPAYGPEIYISCPATLTATSRGPVPGHPTSCQPLGQWNFPGFFGVCAIYLEHFSSKWPFSVLLIPCGLPVRIPGYLSPVRRGRFHLVSVFDSDLASIR